MYAAGSAYPSFPVTPAAFTPQPTSPQQTIGFICKLSPDGSQLLYSTLLWVPLAGADGINQVSAFSVSPDGEMTFTGTRFLLHPTFLQSNTQGTVIARLSTDGQAVLFSQPLNGTVSTLVLDSSGNVVVGGTSRQIDPAPVSLQSTLADVTGYISPDAGATVLTGFGLPATGSMAVDPTNPQTVLRASPVGVFQSHDGGVTWRTVDALGTGLFALVRTTEPPSIVAGLFGPLAHLIPERRRGGNLDVGFNTGHVQKPRRRWNPNSSRRPWHIYLLEQG